MSNNIINLLDNCKDAVIKKDIVALMSCTESLGLDVRFRSPLLDFIKNLIIEDIKDFIVQNNGNSVKISRKGVYHEETFDWYSLKDGELFRNGNKAIFTSVGKLYVAYKRIHKIT